MHQLKFFINQVKLYANNKQLIYNPQINLINKMHKQINYKLEYNSPIPEINSPSNRRSEFEIKGGGFGEHRISAADSIIVFIPPNLEFISAMDRIGQKLKQNKEARAFKQVECAPKSRKEPKKSSSKSIAKSTKRFKNLQFGKTNGYQQFYCRDKNEQKVQKSQPKMQKPSQNDYGVSNFQTKHKDIAGSKRQEYKHMEAFERGSQKLANNQKPHISLNCKQNNAQEYITRHKEATSLHKIRLPQNRGVINADGKFVSCSKEKERKTYSFQNSYTSKNSLSVSNMLSMEKKKKKSKSKNKLSKERSISKGRRIKNKSFERNQMQSNNLGEGKQKSKQAKKKIKLSEHQIKQTNQSQKQLCLQTSTDACIPTIYSISAHTSFQQINQQIIYDNQNARKTTKKMKFSELFLKERALCINLLSHLCGAMEMKRQSFSLAVIYMDQFSFSSQGENLKLVALSSLTLALKMSDAQMICRFCRQLSRNPERTVRKSASKIKKPETSLALEPTSRVSELVGAKIFQDGKKKQEFHLDQILDFEASILLKLNFKLAYKSSSYWVDVITALWDAYITQSFEQQSAFLQFRRASDFKNLSFLNQFVEAQMYSPCCYNYTRPILVLTSLYLIVRLKLHEHKQNIPISELFRSYRTSLSRSSNLIFCDGLGINQLFGDFLQKLDMSMANIIQCAQQASGFLVYEAVRTTEGRQQIQNKRSQGFLSIHTYNKRLCEHFAKIPFS